MTELPLVLIIDDDHIFCGDIAEKLASNFRTMSSFNSLDGLAAIRHYTPEAILLDIRLDEEANGFDVLAKIHQMEAPAPVIMLTEDTNVETIVQSIKRGAYNYITKPPNSKVLIAILSKALEESVRQRGRWSREHEIRSLRGEFIVKDERMSAVLDLVKKIAPKDTTVLITGESGTGKELIARLIHQLSRRSEGPFIEFNCGGSTSELIEDELFGHEKGAFTGADRRFRGCFERANGGTLFLDEVGNSSPELQMKLLRVIENKSFRRIGGEVSIRSDLRIIAATNKIPIEEIKAKRLREDLYYRLCGIEVFIPPLRERLGDILPIAEHYLAQSSNGEILGFTPAAQEYLQSQPWDGNVRELRNAIERALVHCKGRSLDIHDFLSNPCRPMSPPPYRIAKEANTLAFLHDYVSQCLRVTKGIKTRAASLADVTPAQFQLLYKKSGVDVSLFRPSPEEESGQD